MRTRSRVTLTITALLLMAACGGDDDAASEPATEPVAAADSDSDSEPAAEAPAAEEAADAPDEPAGDAAGAPAEEPVDDESAPVASGGENVAVVTIDGQTWEIDVTPGSVTRCDPNFFGAFWALGGDEVAGIELLLPPPGDPNFEEPPMVKVGVADGDIEWIADPSREMFGVDAGESQVDDFSVDGNTVSGTATFVDLNATYAFQGGVGDEPVPVTGTFEVTCAG